MSAKTANEKPINILAWEFGQHLRRLRLIRKRRVLLPRVWSVEMGHLIPDQEWVARYLTALELDRLTYVWTWTFWLLEAAREGEWINGKTEKTKAPSETGASTQTKSARQASARFPRGATAA